MKKAKHLFLFTVLLSFLILFTICSSDDEVCNLNMDELEGTSWTGLWWDTDHVRLTFETFNNEVTFSSYKDDPSDLFILFGKAECNKIVFEDEGMTYNYSVVSVTDTELTLSYNGNSLPALTKETSIY